MKILSKTIAVVLIACFAVGSISIADAGTTKKIGTTLNAKYKAANPDDPYGTSSIKGKVGPQKCAKGRKVRVKGVGSEKTDGKGKFSVDSSIPLEAGRYQVKVAPKKKVRRGKTTVCKRAKVTLTVRKAG